MTSTRSRRLVRGLLLVSIGVAVLLGLLLRGAMLERWYLFELRSSDFAVRSHAARRLAAMGSRRAIDVLVEIAAESREGAPFGPDDTEWWVAGCLSHFDPDLVEVFRRRAAGAGFSLDFHLVNSLGERGPEAAKKYVPILLDALAGDSSTDAAAVLAEQGPTVVASLFEILGKQELQSRRMAAMTLHLLRENGKLPEVPEAVIVALLDLLRDGDWFVRSTAVDALGAFPEHAARTRQGLLAALSDEEASVRRTAVDAVSRVLPVPEAVAALVRGIEAGNGDTFFHDEIGSLEALDPGGAASVPHLIRSLEDRALPGREKLAVPLGRMAALAEGARNHDIAGRGLRALLEALDDADPAVRAGVIWGLERFPSAAQAAIPTLRRLVGDEAKHVRNRAAILLSTLPLDDKAFLLPALARALEEDGNWNAAEAMARLDGVSERAVPHLLRALSHREPYVRECAEKALAKIEIDATILVPELIRILGGGPPTARPAAARVLAQKGHAAGEAVPALLAALGSSDGKLVAHAIHALGRIGPGAAAAVPRLIALQSSQKEQEGCVVTDPDHLPSTALVRIGPPAVSLLLDTLEDAPDAATRLRSCRVLGQIAEPGRDIVPGLATALECEGSEEVRAAAAEALGVPRAGGDDHAVAALARALADASELVRLRAAKALSSRQMHSDEVVRTLAAIVTANDSPHRAEAASSLGAMRSRAGAGVGALRAALGSFDGFLRHEAVTALARIGPPASDALPTLRELLRLTTLQESRVHIAEAIAAIEPDSGSR